MSRLAAAAKALLSDITHFSRLVLRVPLRDYQATPMRAVIKSVLEQRGDEFLLIFPRQSGKNEAVAQLLVYLLNLLQRTGGNIVYGAIGDGIGRGIDRLEQRLDNTWNTGRWTRKQRPLRRSLGQADVVFLSTHPMAHARGETAHWLLVVDELQDQDASHLAAVFTPMRAANNATALYLGTVRLTTDALWLKKQELELKTAQDGRPRVFLTPPHHVTRENPAYGQFLATQEALHGRSHPIIASEYYLEPIDGSGGLFDPRRRALMHGRHPRQLTPTPGSLYVATLDVAGEDEATTDPVAALARPGRDYTVSTIFEVVFTPSQAPGPRYQARDVFVDHGSKHFQEVPGRPPLADRLAAWLNHWQIAHLVADESGVGQGMVSWLREALGHSRVTGYNFAGRGRKAALGSSFLALVETGRFHYWTDDAAIPLSDGWWFWQQVHACQYELPPGASFDRDLRWSVPDAARIDTPTGQEPIHDDRLLSAALVAELDRLRRDGKLRIGLAASTVIAPPDPLSNLKF